MIKATQTNYFFSPLSLNCLTLQLVFTVASTLPGSKLLMLASLSDLKIEHQSIIIRYSVFGIRYSVYVIVGWGGSGPKLKQTIRDC